MLLRKYLAFTGSVVDVHACARTHGRWRCRRPHTRPRWVTSASSGKDQSCTSAAADAPLSRPPPSRPPAPFTPSVTTIATASHANPTTTTPPPLPSNDLLQSLEPGPLPPASDAQDRQDATRLVCVCAGVAALALATELNKDWIGAHQEVAMGAVFLGGYTGIVVEEALGLSKAALALLTAAALWSVRATGEGLQALDAEMSFALGEVSAVVFFLLGAMTVVEVVDSHQGFKVITQSIRPSSRPQLLVAVSVLAFAMSSVLDNLTTTLVMVALLQKLCPDPDARRFLGAAVVVAANAGGAWTPIGDVTTTMLWIHGQISTLPTMRDLLLPSAVSVAVPVAAWALTAPEIAEPQVPQAPAEAEAAPVAPPRSNLVLSVGMGSLLMVPALRAWAGLPPHMGMLACLGVLWLVTDAIHWGEPERRELRVAQALRRVDSEAVLFFTGVLMAVAALQAAGLLREVAEGLREVVPQPEVVAAVIGFGSSIVDNVPLVAATMGMYDMQSYPQDCSLWQLIAYCAGTGGSLLLIGSAAGVAYGGVDRSATFGWYAARISPWATAGYLAGLGTYLLQQKVVAAAAGAAAVTATVTAVGASPAATKVISVAAAADVWQ